MKLSGKVAIVTGGSRGIGQAICLALADEGSSAVVNYLHSQEAAGQVVRAIQDKGGDAMAAKADVSDTAAVSAVFKVIIDRYGRLDVLVNNAGIGIGAPFLEMSVEAWDRVIDVNLKGIFLCSQAASREMIKTGGGRIINITSISGQQVWSGGVNYAASKAGANMLTQAMAVELAPYGILVNAVAAGAVDTDMLRQDVQKPHEWDALVRRTQVGRVAQAQDVAEVVVFLSTLEAHWVTGAIITADGGYTLVGDPPFEAK
jgi:NAD(P)-dependent dehydrogenase (short-subunit alcohol dehydrogenase family)